MTKRIYMHGGPDELRAAVKELNQFSNFRRSYYYYKSPTHLVVKYESIATGINKVSGKRYYRFTIDKIYSFKINEGFLDSYLISFQRNANSNRRTRRVRVFNPAHTPFDARQVILSMCEKNLSDPPEDIVTMSDKLYWYWKPMSYYTNCDRLSRYGLSGRKSTLEDISKAVFGVSNDNILKLMQGSIDFEELLKYREFFLYIKDSSERDYAIMQMIERSSHFRSLLSETVMSTPKDYLDKVIGVQGTSIMGLMRKLGDLCQYLDMSADIVAIERQATFLLELESSLSVTDKIECADRLEDCGITPVYGIDTLAELSSTGIPFELLEGGVVFLCDNYVFSEKSIKNFEVYSSDGSRVDSVTSSELYDLFKMASA